MWLGKRKFDQVRFVLGHRETYFALYNACRILKQPYKIMFHEIFSSTHQLDEVMVKTPSGTIDVKLFDKVDLSTVFGIFCREDYMIPTNSRVIVDVGANIGIASLYFLTRNDNSFVYAYEPVTQNIRNYKINLSRFQDRYALSEVAVGTRNGISKFGIEPTGKFGGFVYDSETIIQVEAIAINDLLDNIIMKHGAIDCLKLDVEGAEASLLHAIDHTYWPFIKCIYAENTDSTVILPKGFIRRWRYNVEQLIQI